MKLNQLSKSSHVGLKYMTARSKLRGFVLFFFFSAYVSKEHSDIVKCVVCYESRVYSGG